MVAPTSAWAGRLIVTGHDAARRCAQLDQQCGFLKTSIKYVRQTAPQEKAPVLVLDRGAKQLVTAINKAWSNGYSYSGPKLKIVDPRSAAFAKLAIDVSHFSAIAIASDSSCGCDLEAADENAIWKRKAVLQKFLSNGGGIYAGAGGTNAPYYYRFMPIPTPGPPDAGPFQLTRYGQRIGFNASDVTDAPANTFAAPDVGRMDVAAQSANKVGDTLIADGKVAKGKLIATTTIPPTIGQSIVVQPVSGVVLGHPPDDPRFRQIVGPAPVGQRQRQVPDQGPLRVRGGPRHRVGDRRPLRRDPRHGQGRRGRGLRPGPPETSRRDRRPPVPGQGAVGAVVPTDDL